MTEVKSQKEAKGEGRLQGSDRFHDVRFGGREWAADWLVDKLSDPAVVLDLTVSVGQTAQVYKDRGLRVFGVDRDKGATAAMLHMKAEKFLDVRERMPEAVRCVDWEPYGVVAGTEVWFALLRNLHKFRLPILIVTGCNPRLPATRVRNKMKWDYHWRTNAEAVRVAFHERTLWKLWARGMMAQARDSQAKIKWLHQIHDEDQRKIVLVGLLGTA